MAMPVFVMVVIGEKKNNIKELSVENGGLYVNVYPLAQPKVLYFEIVERPSKHFLFYLVYSYDNRKIPTDDEFLVSRDGKSFFSVAYNGEKTPFAQVVTKANSMSKRKSAENSGNANKFSE